MYVVFGATGHTGKVVAETLLSRGEKIRVVVRNADKGASWQARGAEVAVADVDDPPALARALAGAAGAYVLSPPDIRSDGFIAQRKKTFEGVARAARQAGVPHIVFLSSIAAHLDSGTGPIVTLHHAEGALGGVTALTSIRAGYFLDNWASVLPVARKDGVLPTFIPAKQATPTVYTADIGCVAAEALLAGPRGRHVIELAGPTDPTPEDVAAAAARSLGRPVATHEVPVEAATFTQFGASPGIAALYVEMYTGIRTGRVAWENPGAVVRGRIGLDEAIGRLAAHN